MKRILKPPTGFFVIAILALIWNLFGVMAYLGQAFMIPELTQGMETSEIEFIENTPAWATAAFALAVWCGFFGVLLLLFRKQFAYYLLAISLVAVLVQNLYNLILSDYYANSNWSAYILPFLVLLFSFFLFWYAGRAKRKGWIA